MKPSTIALFILSTLPLLGQSQIPIGGVDCTVRFADDALSPTVFFIATNDIANYFHSVSGFGRAETNGMGIVHIRHCYTPNLVDRTARFEEEITFLIDEGTTNCVVSSAFTEALAPWNELSTFHFRTNLVENAKRFLSNVSSGTFCSASSAERRGLFRTLTSGVVTNVAVSEATDSDIEDALSDYRNSFRFEPVCYSELEPVPGIPFTFLLPVRAVPLFDGNRESFIMRIRLLYSDERWSFFF